jgi:hypothetical protein
VDTTPVVVAGITLVGTVTAVVVGYLGSRRTTNRANELEERRIAQETARQQAEDNRQANEQLQVYLGQRLEALTTLRAGLHALELSVRNLAGASASERHLVAEQVTGHAREARIAIRAHSAFLTDEERLVAEDFIGHAVGVQHVLETSSSAEEWLSATAEQPPATSQVVEAGTAMMELLRQLDARLAEVTKQVRAHPA